MKTRLSRIVSAMIVGIAAWSASGAITVDFNTVVGPVKPEHGVGQPPMSGMPKSAPMMFYLKHAGVPFSRLHDVGGRFGGGVYVDIPNLFRDFEADETKPENYDFAFTDCLMQELEKNGVEPYFRLGVTIENHAYLRRYRIDPPKDFAKWARICEHVIRHYTEGWADGFKMKIRYWEIWNEPDSKPDPEKSMMWHAPFSEYCRLYDVASKHLKAKFPHLKIGGYAACGFYHITGKKTHGEDDETRFPHYVKCFDEFLAYVKDHGCPLDFYSWHCYDSVASAVVHMKYVRDKLDAAGFVKTESSLNEWLTPAVTPSLAQAVQIAAMMIACQNGPVDNAMVYDARSTGGRYGPIFNPETGTPYTAYWSLKAFNELYVRKNAVKCICTSKDVYAAAADLDGDGALLVANCGSADVPFDLDAGDREIVSCRAIDRVFTYQDAPVPQRLPANSVYLLTFRVKRR